MIKLLDKSVYELIAAGEVIERPSSVIKELVENAVDAGAKRITVEIKNGGITYMRVTDDGCGMAYSEVPTAFLRHATSKLSEARELNSISTLGFRGEALASVAAVTRTEVLTKRAVDELGTAYKIEGGEETLYEETGCPDGTTIIMRDLFFNTPARLKFLKKDSSEANYIQSILDKLALSYPEISFTFIKDNKTARVTAGDGKLYSVIYSIFGKQFAAGLTEVDYSHSHIDVGGYITTPYACRANRQMQYFFINGRSIKNTTCMAALEEGYKNSIMVGKFPACVLNITMPPEDVDVNVSPSKTEVRFADEKAIFEAVYLAVKNGILNAENSKEISVGSSSFEKSSFAFGDNFSSVGGGNVSDLSSKKAESGIFSGKSETESRKSDDVSDNTDKLTFNGVKSMPTVEKLYSAPQREISEKKNYELNSPRAIYRPLPPKNIFIQELFDDNDGKDEQGFDSVISENVYGSDNSGDGKSEEQEKKEYKFLNTESFIRPGTEEEKNRIVPDPIVEEKYRPPLKFIGELFRTYIVCECGDELILMDKHAAHERIRFEQLKKELESSGQLLTDPPKLVLSAEEITALADNEAYLKDLGIELYFDSESRTEIVAFPSLLTDFSPEDTVQKIAAVLLNGGDDIEGLLFDDILHTVACKGAIKANEPTSYKELEILANRVWEDVSIRYCPHGRPIITTMSKYNIERNFGRIQ